MSTIKSNTDLSQSKVLAKILPLDSADMYWDLLSKDKYARVNNIGHCLGRTCVYAWSLAALLGIVCEVKRMDYSDKWEAASWNKSSTEQEYYVDVEGYDNPVDACVALIEKLHELNLL